MGFNIFSFFLELSYQPHSPKHSSTTIDSEEQVDYSGVSELMGGLGNFVEEFDMDYFTPHRRVSLSSPTLATSCSEDSFPVVVGELTISQSAMTLPSVIMVEIPSTVSLPTPTTLPVGREDSLKFSFEVTSGVWKASGDAFPLESTPMGPIAPVTSEGGVSSRISSSVSSLL